MKVLIMSTEGSTMRAEATGWTWEDSSCVIDAYLETRSGENKLTKEKYDCPEDMPIGLCRSWNPYNPEGVPRFPTVMHAMARGWKLLAPPQESTEPRTDPKTYKTVQVTVYEWWLVKD